MFLAAYCQLTDHQPRFGISCSRSYNAIDIAELFSIGELRVYDSQGRVTGLINGEIREEIPNSVYESRNEAVVIFDAMDAYRYEVVGTDTGVYGLTVATTQVGDTQTFFAIDIPSVSGAVHRYSIEWDALVQGENGATIKIDSDGDGRFERTLTSDASFDKKDYESSLPVSNWQLVIGIVIGIIIVVCGIYLVVRFL